MAGTLIQGIVSILVSQAHGQVLLAAGGPADWWSESSPDFTVNGVARRHVTRLNSDGSLDTTFSATFPTNLRVTGVAAQADGKILVTAQKPGTSETGLIRFDVSGKLDSAFTTTAVTGHPTYPDNIVAALDGTILVTDWAGRYPVRLKSDGSRDERFRPPPDSILRTVLPDGRLMALIETNGVLSLVRLTSSGLLDSTFARMPINNTFYPPLQIIPAGDGKIWVLNRMPGGVEFLTRKNPDGSDDPTWPVALIRDMGSSGPNAELVSLPDGNLLVAGIPSGQINGQPRRSLARLLVNAPRTRFEVDPASAMVPENGGKLSIKLLRCGTNTEPITLAWWTEGGSAKPGVDYLAASGTLTFPANESVAMLELEVLDNMEPDENRTVRLRLQGPPPERPDFPIVEITIANDDLGFSATGIKRFTNGNVLLRPTGYLLGPAFLGSLIGGHFHLQSSENLGDWFAFASVSSGRPEVMDNPASTNAASFFRLLQSHR